MKKIVITHYLLFLSISFCFTQNTIVKNSNDISFIKGNITNYANKPLFLYKCYKDTLLFIDSIQTNRKGEFLFSSLLHGRKTDLNPGRRQFGTGLYKIQMLQNQFFYIIHSDNEEAIEIKTVHQPDVFNNNATDSLEVLKSEENQLFCEFQTLQKKLNIADAWLLQMMRLYPLSDPFHNQIEDEYFKRYKAMDEFVKSSSFRGEFTLSETEVKQSVNYKEQIATLPKVVRNDGNFADVIALAYYQPVHPDWKQPDNWRDSIIANHYFDYFNPADSFYLHTNILPEKMELYLKLKTNKVDGYGQPVRDEMFAATAAHEFLEKTKNSLANFEFCFNYLLKKFSKEHLDNAFLFLYDTYAKPQAGNCESSVIISGIFKEKANKLRNIAIGSYAPDFVIMDGKLNLSQLPSNNVLVLFWASWCPHCADEIPKIKAALEQSKQNIMVVAVSLDTDTKQWEQFVEENAMANWVNITDFKSWNGTIPKQYNVYATPSMFLLDKNKKIIAKPETTNQLIKAIEVL